MTHASLEFHPLTESDLPLLHSWLNRPHVLEWWTGETSVEEVRAKYLPSLTGSGKPRLSDGVPICRSALPGFDRGPALLMILDRPAGAPAAV
jgi:hypothetical protein